MIWPILTWGSGGVAAPEEPAGDGPYWAYPLRVRTPRIFVPRVRDAKAEHGRVQDDDPTLDTWEGEAT